MLRRSRVTCHEFFLFISDLNNDVDMFTYITSLIVFVILSRLIISLIKFFPELLDKKRFYLKNLFYISISSLERPKDNAL